MCKGKGNPIFISESNTGLAFMSRGQTTSKGRGKFLSGHIATALLNISGFVVPMYKFEVLRISERNRSQQDGEVVS